MSENLRSRNPRLTAGPLTGVTVVEFVGIGPGPFAAMLLADLGAEVVSIDRPGGQTLQVAPADKDVMRRGRGFVEIDVKADRDRVFEITDRADILVEGFRPGVMERLGLGPDALLARNPRLVYGRITGWGQDGPLAHTAGHDLNYIAVAGALDSIGHERPEIPINTIGDFAGGSLYLVTGVLAALTHARATGEGQVVDAAIVDGVAHLLAMSVSMQQAGVWDGQRGHHLLAGGAPFYDVYETSDGGWMSVGGLEPQFWAAFEERIGTDLPDRNDLRNWAELRRVLAATFRTRTRAEWTALFVDSDACVAPVLPLSEAYEHPHLVHRGTYVERDGLVQPAPAPRFSRTPTL